MLPSSFGTVHVSKHQKFSRCQSLLFLCIGYMEYYFYTIANFLTTDTKKQLSTWILGY